MGKEGGTDRRKCTTKRSKKEKIETASVQSFTLSDVGVPTGKIMLSNQLRIRNECSTASVDTHAVSVCVAL